ncbi:MAG: hypothetical protein ACLUNZ_12175 [Evtepia sp.]
MLALLGEYDTPVLFCTGADTLNLVSRRREEFAAVARFLEALPPQVLDDLNDKETVHQRAIELGPCRCRKEFAAVPDRYPVVIKPHCGEKVGLRAGALSVIAENTADYMAKYSAMARYGADPIVQEKVVGPGEGVNLLLDEQSRLICAFCHRRLREYPASGGPSTCCVSFYDAGMIDQAYRLLASFGFVGMAMVEFKGGKILEVNPRVWGASPSPSAAARPLRRCMRTQRWGNPWTIRPRTSGRGSRCAICSMTAWRFSITCATGSCARPWLGSRTSSAPARR